MSSKKTNTIFSVIIGAMLIVLGFFCGSIFENHKFVEERESYDKLIEEGNSAINEYLETTDWNALKNIEANAITTDCKRCSPKVSAAFKQLDKRKAEVSHVVVR